MAGAIQAILNFKENMSDGLRRIAGQSEENQRQIRLLDNRVQDFRDNASSGLKSVAGTAIGLTAAFAGIGGAAITLDATVDSVKEYSSALSQLSAETGYTGAEFDNMKSSMVAVYGNNFGESWADVGESMAAVTQITGQTGKALEASTENALVFRDVFKAEIPESVGAVDSMMRNFGVTSDQAFNLLAQGSQTGLNKTGELLDGVSEFGVQFSQLGFTADETFDTFAAGLESGAFSLATVGDAVKEFGIITREGGDGATDAFRTLGFNANKMVSTFAKGGPEAKKSFDQVVKALDKVKDPVKKNALGVSLFGTTWEDLGSSAITTLAEVEKGFDGTTDTMGKLNEVKYTDLESAIGGISRTLETSIVTPLADKVLPKLSELSTWVTSKTPEIKKGIDNAFKTGKKLMDDFGDAMDWAKKNADWLVPSITAITAAIVAQQAVNGISGVIAAYKAWRVSTTGLTVAQAAFNAVMAANPLGWIAILIGAVVAGGVLLWKNWDTAKAKASELWSWISGVWTNLKDGTINVFTGIKDSVVGAFSSMLGAAKTPINGIIDLVNGLINNINGISFSFPDWIPGDLGGKEFGLSIPTIPTFAEGTNNAPGGMSLVGEEGPEIVNLRKGSSVTTADKTRKLLSGSKQEINITIQIENMYGEDDLMNRIGPKFVSMVKQALPNVATS